MPGSKLPILTITNKEYFRDDGLYIYSSTDGQLDIIADTTAKIGAPTVEINDTTTLKFTNNNGTVASGNYSGTPFSSVDLSKGPSGTAIGWIKVTIGTVNGYVPVYSGSAVA